MRAAASLGKGLLSIMRQVMHRPAHFLLEYRMMRHNAALAAVRLLVFGTLTWVATGCAATVASRSPSEPVVREDHRVERRPVRYARRGPPLGVPRGHLPPPGKCRVWFPGQPPGHQPRPVSCDKAMAYAPAGSWVLYRPRKGKEVHARVIDSRRSGVVVSVRVYAAAEGIYLRTERP
jgi:hypothetical protein